MGTYGMAIACDDHADPGDRGPAVAGPPYQSDDPEPTNFGHFEIYTFDKGAFGRSGSSSASGLDFNYGAAPDLQLTAAVPFGYDAPSDGPSAFGPGNVELAAKYRFYSSGHIRVGRERVPPRLPAKPVADGRSTQLDTPAHLD